ncbi:hypothetical protein ACKFKG_25530 [Phormidesmis sp. 146-35]
MSLLKEELMLRIDREIRYRMDGVIEKLGKLAREFDIGHEDTSKRSPLRNILLVASDPTSSIETIKTYMRYQAARDIKVLGVKRRDRRFVDALILQLEELEDDAKAIFEQVKTSLPKQHQLGEYFQTPEYTKDLKDLHLRLAQLYLGSLVREHTALVEEGRNPSKAREEKNFNQSKPDAPSKAFERPSKPQKRN